MNTTARRIAGFCLALTLAGSLHETNAFAQKRGKSTQRKTSPAADKMFEVQTISQQAADCNEVNAACATVNIKVPTLASGTNEAARDAINSVINRVMLSSGGSDKPSQTLETLAYDFLNEYEQVRARDTEYRIKWTLDKTFAVVRNDGKVLALSFTERRFSGGSSTTEVIAFANFRLEDGASLKLSDLFVDGYEAKLLPLAEQKFRTLKRIKPGKGFSESGYTFDGDRFQLTDNFSVTGSGLRFHWNSGEISTSLTSTTDLVIDWKSVTDLLKPEAMTLLGIVKKEAAKPQ